MSLLKISHFTKDKPHSKLGFPVLEAGLDEAGAGALMGPVTGAAVVWPYQLDEDDANRPEYKLLRDSKKLTANQRSRVKEFIKAVALDYQVIFIDNKRIDQINILNARMEAMAKAAEHLTIKPEFLLVDGDKWYGCKACDEYTNVIGGDNKYQSIAAASILAKCARDEYVQKLDEINPNYGWISNKGYGTGKHFEAIDKHGVTPYHRKSFNLSKNFTKKKRDACLIEENS